MKLSNKLKFNLISIITLIFLIYYVLKDNLLTTNISRIANRSSIDYFLFIILSILFGITIYKALRRVAYLNLSYLGILSLFIGGIVPYNYLEVSSFNSNLHLILALSSIIIILILELLIINRFKLVKLKLANYLYYGLIIVAIITLYLYSKYDFMNSLNELIYLGYVLIINVIVYNVLND